MIVECVRVWKYIVLSMDWFIIQCLHFWFYNQARIVVYYIVMGYQFDQDNLYNSSLYELVGASTIVDDDAPPVNYIDDANRHTHG
jgi:hypothetical protein